VMAIWFLNCYQPMYDPSFDGFLLAPQARRIIMKPSS